MMIVSVIGLGLHISFVEGECFLKNSRENYAQPLLDRIKPLYGAK